MVELKNVTVRDNALIKEYELIEKGLHKLRLMKSNSQKIDQSDIDKYLKRIEVLQGECVKADSINIQIGMEDRLIVIKKEFASFKRDEKLLKFNRFLKIGSDLVFKLTGCAVIFNDHPVLGIAVGAALVAGTIDEKKYSCSLYDVVEKIRCLRELSSKKMGIKI